MIVHYKRNIFFVVYVGPMKLLLCMELMPNLGDFVMLKIIQAAGENSTVVHKRKNSWFT